MFVWGKIKKVIYLKLKVVQNKQLLIWKRAGNDSVSKHLPRCIDKWPNFVPCVILQATVWKAPLRMLQWPIKAWVTPVLHASHFRSCVPLVHPWPQLPLGALPNVSSNQCQDWPHLTSCSSCITFCPPVDSKVWASTNKSLLTSTQTQPRNRRDLSSQRIKV